MPLSTNPASYERAFHQLTDFMMAGKSPLVYTPVRRNPIQARERWYAFRMAWRFKDQQVFAILSRYKTKVVGNSLVFDSVDCSVLEPVTELTEHRQAAEIATDTLHFTPEEIAAASSARPIGYDAKADLQREEETLAKLGYGGSKKDFNLICQALANLNNIPLEQATESVRSLSPTEVSELYLRRDIAAEITRLRALPT